MVLDLTNAPDDYKARLSMRWALPQLPTGSDVARLVEQKVITVEEARKILFKPLCGHPESARMFKVSTMGDKDVIVCGLCNKDITEEVKE